MKARLENHYLNIAPVLANPDKGFSARVEWECPSNIALVKYWGKRQGQFPLNPSVSFVLHRSRTLLSMEFKVNPDLKMPQLDYYFEGKQASLFRNRYMHYLQHISRYMPFINQLELTIRTRNTFPHSAGIASSASSFGALALALCDTERLLFETLTDEKSFFEKASFLSRLGSGSASRSVLGGFSMWGEALFPDDSSDEAAVSLAGIVHPVFYTYRDSILVVYAGVKEIPSSEGHALMDHHPFATARINQAKENAQKLLHVLATGDEPAFVEIVEKEALSLHAMMLTSSPSFILLKPYTIEVIDRIRKFRKDTGLTVCFTLDAGANVHFLYPDRLTEIVHPFIAAELKALCENGMIIHDHVGTGPVRNAMTL